MGITTFWIRSSLLSQRYRWLPSLLWLGTSSVPSVSSSYMPSCRSRVPHVVGDLSKPFSRFVATISLRYLSTSSNSQEISGNLETSSYAERHAEEVHLIDEWEEEEEDEAEPFIGDGGDGGGIVLKNCPWGEQALSIAHEVLLQFGDDDDDFELFAFKTSPKGYIYLRLEKLSNEYGCPSMDEIENYSRQYKRRLDELSALGEIPENLALEVSSPGAERLIRVPDDLERFKEKPMMVSYMDSQEKTGMFVMERINSETGSCIWKLADVKENRDPSARGRPFSRKLKDWRLDLPFSMIKRVTFYLD
ncbi:uncharacterized protein LOC124917159 [Impatiens glandulifera]|uniref:uncharacterized protein LOC124917159 n=1 Tax=Impatiens glandulifera TaxID=253017 RepID=UPI001FB162D3|nr:uncharacterized protein LOC124917159 [Impatiens glandulifera]